MCLVLLSVSQRPVVIEAVSPRLTTESPRVEVSKPRRAEVTTGVLWGAWAGRSRNVTPANKDTLLVLGRSVYGCRAVYVHVCVSDVRALQNRFTHTGYVSECSHVGS